MPVQFLIPAVMHQHNLPRLSMSTSFLVLKMNNLLSINQRHQGTFYLALFMLVVAMC